MTIMDILDEKKQKNVTIDAQDVKAYLDKYIMGQEDAKIAASMCLLNNSLGVKDNVLFIGASGSGKTEIFRRLQEYYQNKFGTDTEKANKVFIFDSSHITESGIVGENFNSVFMQMRASGFSKDEIEHAIIVFDEFDKTVAPRIVSGGTNISTIIQGELLTMIENGNIAVGKEGKEGYKIYNTSKMNFAFCGAFTELRDKKTKKSRQMTIGFTETDNRSDKIEIDFDDLIEYGMINEVAGRISTVVTLNTLTKDQIERLISDENMGVVANLKRKYSMFDLDISITKEFEDELVASALDNKRGLRYINGRAQAVFNRELFSKGSTGLIIINRMERIIQQEEIEVSDDEFDEDDEFDWGFKN